MRRILILLLAATFCGCSSGAPLSFPASEATGLRENENVLLGDNYMFSVETPSNWTVDSESGKRHGIDAVFFPRGSNWNGSVIMYPRVWQKVGGVTLAQVMEEDLRQYTQSFPDIRSTNVAPIEISAAAVGRVRQFTSESRGVYEAVAYIDRSSTVVVLVLRATTEANFSNALQLFEVFVRSYRPLEHLMRPIGAK
jgi:hypothetical protein